MGVKGYPGVDPQMVLGHQPEPVKFITSSALKHNALLKRIEEGKFHPPSAAFFDLQPAWPWPKGDAQCQNKGDQERFNQAAHDAFMRSLG